MAKETPDSHEENVGELPETDVPETTVEKTTILTGKFMFPDGSTYGKRR